jgi:hypothetical protein
MSSRKSLITIVEALMQDADASKVRGAAQMAERKNAFGGGCDDLPIEQEVAKGS